MKALVLQWLVRWLVMPALLALAFVLGVFIGLDAAVHGDWLGLVLGICTALAAGYVMARGDR